jgi:RNA polymerase sigma factor (TIGR02999 family)
VARAVAEQIRNESTQSQAAMAMPRTPADNRMGSESPSGEVTRLLHAIRGGDRSALDRLLPQVYRELRSVARRISVRHAPSSLQPTALVHEAYMKLARSGELQADDRAHFLAIAAAAMRQVVVDQARAALSQKRGGGWVRTLLRDDAAMVELDPESLIGLERALAQLDERQRTIVECRFFGGMEETEIADALGVSTRTVRREWVKARAWLYAELYPGGEAPVADT